MLSFVVDPDYDEDTDQLEEEQKEEESGDTTVNRVF
jgi:hypothetical protein